MARDGTIGGGVSNLPAGAGSFADLAASGTVSGAGFINYFAAPPALGADTPAAVSATTLTTSGVATVAADIVLPKTSGKGIMVDTTTPTFGWRDIIGKVAPKISGAGAPARAVYAGGNVNDYAFTTNDVTDFDFHIPHDWVPGTDMYFHVHWSHNGTTITGNAVFDLYYQVAKRDGIFTAEKDLTITYATVNIATTPQYYHRVDETQMTASVATATLTATSALEVDGIIMATLKLTTLPTIGGGGKLFIHTCDLHYQSSNIGTKNKVSNFYA